MDVKFWLLYWLDLASHPHPQQKYEIWSVYSQSLEMLILKLRKLHNEEFSIVKTIKLKLIVELMTEVTKAQTFW